MNKEIWAPWSMPAPRHKDSRISNAQTDRPEDAYLHPCFYPTMNLGIRHSPLNIWTIRVLKFSWGTPMLHGYILPHMW